MAGLRDGRGMMGAGLYDGMACSMIGLYMVSFSFYFSSFISLYASLRSSLQIVNIKI
jgi:hypothetical protein